MSANQNLTIDLEQIVKSKVKNHKVPKFIINWGKRFIHQDFINAYLEKGYEGVEFCKGVLDYLDITIETEGLENLDILKEHLCTVVSNHPLGGVDGVTLTTLVGERCDGNVRLMVNDFLMFIKPIASISVPVNKVGGQSRNLSAQVDEIYSSSSQLMIFPAGLNSRKTNGIIRDPEWKKTFIKKSVENGRWIVPVHFIGENSKRFYRVANISKKLGLKFNLAMLLLPDEMYRARHGKFKVIIGKPIPPTFFDSSKTPKEWAQYMKELVYSM